MRLALTTLPGKRNILLFGKALLADDYIRWNVLGKYLYPYSTHYYFTEDFNYAVLFREIV
jgi:hypothetical protein